MQPSDPPARSRLRAIASPWYEPEEHAEAILADLERMEALSSAEPKRSRFRRSTGLTCAAEFRGRPKSRTEDAITAWLAELHPNAESQVRDLVPGAWPDICFAFAQDRRGTDALVVLEAKPVWQRWITSGARSYAGATSDEFGRSTGNYAAKNVAQVVSDRDKLLRTYSDPRDRHLLLALVFQRPRELDQRLVAAVGAGWSVRTRHVVDRCNPMGDNIGMTGMVFWPNL